MNQQEQQQQQPRVPHGGIPRLRLRRAGARWREGAPEYVLDVFRHVYGYTVFFTAEFAVWNGGYLGWEVAHLEMNEQPESPCYGVSLWGTARASVVAEYRYRNGHKRVRWLALPEHIRAHVIARATEE